MAPEPKSCAVCQHTRNLTDHHIHPQEYKESYPNGPENINEYANLVLICQGCHAAIHDKRPYHKMVRDLKTQIRRAPKVKTYQNEEQQRQSLKDQEIQRIVWNRLIDTLQDFNLCRKLDGYRQIVRTVERLHKTCKGLQEPA